MDPGLSLLFRLMSASWVLIGSFEGEKKEKKAIDKADQEEWLFPSDRTFD